MENDRKSNEKRRSADCEIEIQQWQIEHVQASIKQANAGRLIDHEQVRKMAAGWRRSSKTVEPRAIVN